ncbi:uncharacterized protein TNCV_823981 [Trichonephila clavipes]|nr:uncharacterized protein TNCV_823981 [Trichonephila clavipes]
MHVNYVKEQTSSRRCGVEDRRLVCQLMYHLRHLTIVENYGVHPSSIAIVQLYSAKYQHRPHYVALECKGRGCDSPVVKESDHGMHAMSSSPVPIKTHRVGERFTLNPSNSSVKDFDGCGSPVIKVSDNGKHVMSSSLVPLKTRRVEQRCTLNLSRAETFSWCGMVVRREGCQLRCRPHHLTMVQNYVVCRQKPSCS